MTVKVLQGSALVLKTHDDGSVEVIEAPQYAEADLAFLCQSIGDGSRGVWVGERNECFTFGSPEHGEYRYKPVDFKADGFNPMVVILERIS